MIDPKPLFDDEVARPAGALDLSGAPDRPSAPPAVRGIAVGPLDLAGTPDAGATRPASVEVRAVGRSDASGLAQAIERGTVKFPAVMRDSGFLVRNSLDQLLPLDFDRLSSFGAATLQRVAALIGELAAFNGRLHEIDAEGVIAGIAEAARAHAAHRRQTSFLGLLGELLPFDAAAAARQIASLHQALLLHLARLTAMADASRRLQATLVVEVTTLAILGDMSDHGTMGEPVERRARLFSTSLQEVGIATSQIDASLTQVQAWAMRCDEVMAVTLPALGYAGSL